jgi:monofunctional biosynthetic peptidoglycan transglycosylase
VRRALALAALGALLAGILFWVTLPDVSPLATSWPKTTAFIERRKALLAASGKPARLEWTPVPLSRISKEMQRAAVVAEDARFFEHDGVDWTAMREAAARNLERGGVKVGGSTITQQLAKNLYLTPARTPWRKLRELAIARRLERRLTKKRILELYLNVIEFGTRTFGVEAASRRYFGKPASELTREEAATLAAVIPSPRIFDPKKYPERVAKRAERILRWM